MRPLMPTKVIVRDCVTNQITDTIDLRKRSEEITSEIIKDDFFHDLMDKRNGLIIEYMY